MFTFFVAVYHLHCANFAFATAFHRVKIAIVRDNLVIYLPMFRDRRYPPVVTSCYATLLSRNACDSLHGEWRRERELARSSVKWPLLTQCLFFIMVPDHGTSRITADEWRIDWELNTALTYSSRSMAECLTAMNRRLNRRSVNGA